MRMPTTALLNSCDAGQLRWSRWYLSGPAAWNYEGGLMSMPTTALLNSYDTAAAVMALT